MAKLYSIMRFLFKRQVQPGGQPEHDEPRPPPSARGSRHCAGGSLRHPPGRGRSDDPQLRQTATGEPGFSPDRLLTMRISPGFPPYTMQTVKALGDRIPAKMKAITGVESAALASNFPFSPSGVVSGPGANDYEIEGKPASKTDVKPAVDVTVVGSNYFETIRQPIVKGRSFTERDESSGPAVAIVNETMARRHFPNENPVGKRIRFDDGMSWTPWMEIVGVAGDVREYGRRGTKFTRCCATVS